MFLACLTTDYMLFQIRPSARPLVGIRRHLVLWANPLTGYLYTLTKRDLLRVGRGPAAPTKKKLHCLPRTALLQRSLHKRSHSSERSVSHRVSLSQIFRAVHADPHATTCIFPHQRLKRQIDGERWIGLH